MWLGLSGRFRARWSAQIHDEWKRNLLINRPDLTNAQLDRTSALMDLAIPDGLVTGHEALIAGLTLPDADDCHVLDAAIRCNASVIVTFNERNFPAAALAPYGIKAQHPDSRYLERTLPCSKTTMSMCCDMTLQKASHHWRCSWAAWLPPRAATFEIAHPACRRRPYKKRQLMVEANGTTP